MLTHHADSMAGYCIAKTYQERSLSLPVFYSIVTFCFRKLLGHFNVLSVSFLPALLASYVAILLERPSRRSLLALYVTNVVSCHEIMMQCKKY
jgi:hypothetical protein